MFCRNMLPYLVTSSYLFCFGFLSHMWLRSTNCTNWLLANFKFWFWLTSYPIASQACESYHSHHSCTKIIGVLSWLDVMILISLNNPFLPVFLLLECHGSNPPVSNCRRPGPRSLHHRRSHPGCGHHRHGGKLPRHICFLQVPFFLHRFWINFLQLTCSATLFVCICDNIRDNEICISRSISL